MEFRSNPPLFLLQLSRVAEPIRFYRDIHVQKGSIPPVFSYYTRLDGCPGGDSVHGVELFQGAAQKAGCRPADYMSCCASAAERSED